MSVTVTRAEVEQAIWKFTGFTGDQVQVDALLAIVDAYRLSPVVAEDTAHLLMNMSSQLLDSGGPVKLTLAPQFAAEPVVPEGDLYQCSNCQEWKPRSEYKTDRSRPEGIRSKCKSCVSRVAA
jgi:hypothetical protein